MSGASVQVLRVEAGLPGAGAELSGDFTPLESGLRSAVSENKGCYTGQEIIARQISYDKITQFLVGLHLDTSTALGTRLYSEGRPVGAITSVAISPRFGAIALGIVRRPHHETGTLLHAGLESDGGIAARW